VTRPARRLHLKCFTAIEILHLAWLAKKTVEQTLRELKDAGLKSLTGGGAEIFRKEVRSAIAKGKESAEEYLDVHRTWHKLGGRSTCTMLYGHVESLADRVDHLRQLRALQDETKGFTAFVPWSYKRGNTPMESRIPHVAGASRYLRILAAARLYLDNFDHIQASWFGEGKKTGQIALHFGADDFGGTLIAENVHLATGHELHTSVEETKILIREAGFIPVQRTTLYDRIRRFDT
jgi:CofH subfamily radical SAM domain protein